MSFLWLLDILLLLHQLFELRYLLSDIILWLAACGLGPVILGRWLLLQWLVSAFEVFVFVLGLLEHAGELGLQVHLPHAAFCATRFGLGGGLFLLFRWIVFVRTPGILLRVCGLWGSSKTMLRLGGTWREHDLGMRPLQLGLRVLSMHQHQLLMGIFALRHWSRCLRECSLRFRVRAFVLLYFRHSYLKSLLLNKVVCARFALLSGYILRLGSVLLHSVLF